jgi:prophage maintenance system killer protein
VFILNANHLNGTVFNRVITPSEKQAYKNLKEYDGGIYKIKNYEKIKEILDEDLPSIKCSNNELDITMDEVNEYMNYSRLLNLRHADFNPGIYIEANSYEASFAKKVYYNSELEFIVSLFISHHNIHAFDDGNKRTALNLFVDLLHKFTGFYIKDIMIIQDTQILYLEKVINEEDFKHIIYYEVKRRVFNTSIKCNLEHFIPRSGIEDNDNFVGVAQTDRRSSINLTDLEKGQFFYQSLRKPFFQRDTNQWTVARVEKLISTFLEDGLIPAVIMWEYSDGDIYIIDGAHRLSSLIAWVNSDYGKEKELNGSNHDAIEEYINSQIGSYDEIKRSKDEKYKQAKQIIAKRSIAVQWVNGDYKNAKESFIRINEQGVIISQDEKELIENDQLPTSKLSRAILAHGLGQVSKNKSEKTKLIFERFFTPYLSHQLNNYPLVGSLNEDLVISRIYNAVKIIDDSKSLNIEQLKDKVLDILKLIQDELNVSQKIYFYGATKKFKTNSFYGLVYFMLELNTNKELKDLFIKNRKEFEEFLVNNERNIQIIARQKRQAKKAYEEVGNYYKVVLQSCESKNLKELKEKYYYLDFEKKKAKTTKEKNLEKNYELFISKVPRCDICGGFIDGNKDEHKVHNCCKIIEK